MKQEERRLLLKDLCARWPYGVKINIRNDYTLTMEDMELNVYHLNTASYDIEYRGLRPYLRPLSSMTVEEKKDLSKVLNYEFYIDDDFALVAEDDRHRIRLELCEGYIDWLNVHHFDYRKAPDGKTMIEANLALEAPEDMYKIK